jgi:hypothetical protein
MKKLTPVERERLAEALLVAAYRAMQSIPTPYWFEDIDPIDYYDFMD